MPRYICHHEGMFFEWSTVVDAPVTYGMNREAFETYYAEEYGRSRMHELPERMERAERTGTSCMLGYDSLESLMAFNRAGPKGGCAKFSTLIRKLKAGQGL
jgi:hypothetical protein